MISSLLRYFAETKQELRKASWPWDPNERGVKRYRELIDSTVVVIIAVVLMAALITSIDLIMQGFYKAMLWLSQIGVG